MRTVGQAEWEQQGQQDMGDVMDVDEGKGNGASSTAAPGSGNGYHPVATPVPDSPALSAQLLSSSSSPIRHPEWESSSDKKSELSHAPVAARAQ